MASYLLTINKYCVYFVIFDVSPVSGSLQGSRAGCLGASQLKEIQTSLLPAMPWRPGNEIFPSAFDSVTLLLWAGHELLLLCELKPWAVSKLSSGKAEGEKLPSLINKEAPKLCSQGMELPVGWGNYFVSSSEAMQISVHSWRAAVITVMTSLQFHLSWNHTGTTWSPAICPPQLLQADIIFLPIFLKISLSFTLCFGC